MGSVGGRRKQRRAGTLADGRLQWALHPQAIPACPHPTPGRRADQRKCFSSIPGWVTEWAEDEVRKGQRDPAWYLVSGTGWMMFYKKLTTPGVHHLLWGQRGAEGG